MSEKFHGGRLGDIYVDKSGKKWVFVAYSQAPTVKMRPLGKELADEDVTASIHSLFVNDLTHHQKADPNGQG